MYGYYPSAVYNPQLYQPQNTNNDERIWVQNETSAEAYLVAPNGFVRLWDASQPVFYEKHADPSGKPYPMEVYEYTRRSPQKPQISENQGNLYDDKFKALEKRIEAIEEDIRHAESDADDTAV